MCLLITGASNKIRATLLNTEGLMLDIFKANEDGLGAMYTTSKRKLRTPKILPKTLGECIAFIRQLPDDDRPLALHWRFRTHGDTNLENCHPYTVLDGQIALMHNGVLSQGNKRDQAKSDTWHYINDVVRPQLAEFPTLFMNKSWMRLIEDDIGNNRFAIMDNVGNLVVLNKHDGVEHDGLWFSNTYAWSPELLIPGYGRRTSHWTDYLSDDAWTSYYRGGSAVPTAPHKVKKIKAVTPSTLKAEVEDSEIVPGPIDMIEEDLWDCIRMGDADQMHELLLEVPNTVLLTLTRECEFVPASSYLTVPDDYSDRDKQIIQALVDGKVTPLVDIIHLGESVCKHVAEAICWYGDWVGKEPSAQGATPDVHDANDAVSVIERVGKALDALDTRHTPPVSIDKITQDVVDEAREAAARDDEVAREVALDRELALAMGANEVYSG